jgi:hypothetical protein
MSVVVNKKLAKVSTTDMSWCFVVSASSSKRIPLEHSVSHPNTTITQIRLMTHRHAWFMGFHWQEQEHCSAALGGTSGPHEWQVEVDAARSFRPRHSILWGEKLPTQSQNVVWIRFLKMINGRGLPLVFCCVCPITKAKTA